MEFAAHIYPPMPTRSCRFCLNLQDGSVFADFDVDEEGQVCLLRISFDGYGCCHSGDGFKKMSPKSSQLLVSAVDRGVVEDRAVEAALRGYFRENSDRIWREALTEHELL